MEGDVVSCTKCATCVGGVSVGRGRGDKYRFKAPVSLYKVQICVFFGSYLVHNSNGNSCMLSHIASLHQLVNRRNNLEETMLGRIKHGGIH